MSPLLDADILRGNVYYVGFPFDVERPLTFVEAAADGTMTVLQKAHGFEPEFDIHGKPHAREVDVVVPHKMRLAVVLQDDLINSSVSQHYTIIAPIESLYEKDKREPIVAQAMKSNDVDRIHYITCTGRDAVVEVSRIRRIHKSLLLKETQYMMSGADVEQVLYKLSSLLQIRRIPACEDCAANCDRCVLRAQGGHVPNQHPLSK